MGVSGRLRFAVCVVLAFTMFLPMALFPQKTQGDSLLSGISSGKTRVLDLSYAINDKLVPWPGDEKWFEAKVKATVEKKRGRIVESSIVLLRTGWASRWPDAGKYRNHVAQGKMHFPGLSAEAAK